ncbi:MAG: hypothetical protein HOC63_11800 [Rhodospirillales bacterium]|jgi:hypothetical protein|nr:hypothetical protein [Rhodospirillales bacterium]MBT4627361.1 hypothetical protein [Rhodospirillales bacterium]MBT5350903.1 hypothetical protein [Rhodospirillales bacterium]MBT7147026.1 hypothetical protein [Rhodospirillales bacterium]MBT7779948.1 hypothetical protein [Rhodospirillales bacterium]
MRRLILALAMVVMVSPAWGANNGSYNYYGTASCINYLDAYANAKLEGVAGYTGGFETWRRFGWISGYITAYNRFNENGKENIIGDMTLNDARRWLASWCRDTPSKDIEDALLALFSSMK